VNANTASRHQGSLFRLHLLKKNKIQHSDVELSLVVSAEFQCLWITITDISGRLNDIPY